MTASAPVAERPARRARYVIAALVCLAVIGGLLWFGLSRNIVYFRTASEAVQTKAEIGDDRFRLAGEVVPGSVRETADGVAFSVSDGVATVDVVHIGDPPQLFKDGAPVVCEGRWGKAGAFASDRIMIKHGNEYTPPAVDVTSAPATGP